MAQKKNPEFNQYRYTPRKVFDTYIDRMATKRQRDRADHRSDLALVFQQIRSLEDQLAHLVEHVQTHCGRLLGEDTDGKDGSEELE